MSSTPFRILFGDIHNHNALGYGLGSLERSIEIARTHLDFFAFTGHSSWHDIAPMEGGRERHWLDGFARLEAGWPKVQALTAAANAAGEFVSFLGFEWHSSRFGDQCVVFPDDGAPLFYTDHIAQLRRFCAAHSALMIPHHLAYPRGMRGVNWEVFDEARTPVVEVFSEHGNAEDDRGPYPYVAHSMGGRATANTVRAALDKGLRFGFVASSDSHRGFPGAYGEGVMAALATDLTRAAVFEAIAARRTYALTGDRIEVDFTIEGAPMGATIAAGRTVEAAFSVAGRDEIDVVEVIQDGRIVDRAYAAERIDAKAALAAPVQVRFEWGWGPWGDLALERVCDWRFAIEVRGGRLLRAFPCLRSGPFDEDRRHRIARTGDNRLAVVSYSSRRGAFRGDPNHSLVLEIEPGPGLELSVEMDSPVRARHVAGWEALFAGSQHWRTGPFPAESCQWHRIVPRAASALSGRCRLELARAGARTYAYLRVRQRNGHMAWSSPIFLNYR